MTRQEKKRERRRAYDKTYREAYLTKKRLQDKQRYQLHRDTITQRRRDYYHANRERLLARRYAREQARKPVQLKLFPNQ